jgi:hypothetical protein
MYLVPLAGPSEELSAAGFTGEGRKREETKVNSGTETT